jgi:uncharacterized membrane protein YkvA (DUF1232 family)
MGSMLPAIGRRLRALTREVTAVWFCARHPRTPFAAKALAAAIVVYAFSPIDLIPDFIPVLGYLDDLLLLPAGIWLVVKMVPDDVMIECRLRAEQWLAQRQPNPRSYAGMAIIVAIWMLLLWLAWRVSGL